MQQHAQAVADYDKAIALQPAQSGYYIGRAGAHGAGGDHQAALADAGKAAGLQAGFDAARGRLIATLDGDLQNDPYDIPSMVAELNARDLDLLCGWRKARQDALVLRKIPSWCANYLIGTATGVKALAARASRAS